MRHSTRTLTGTILAAAMAGAFVAGCRQEQKQTQPKPKPARPKPIIKPRMRPGPRTAATTEPAAQPATAPGEARPVWRKPKTVTMAESFRVFTKMKKYDQPAIRVPQVKVAPAVDGVLDPEYKPATPIEFGFLTGREAKPTAGTTVYLVSTAKDLFVFFDCRSPEMANLQATVRTHDAQVWTDDSVELFLDPTDGRHMSSYYHIAVNPLGTTADVLAPKANADQAWDPKMRVQTQVGQKGWTVELAIPFAELGAASPQRVWAANFNRMARLKAGDEDTAWRPTGGTDSHVPIRFGYLWLDGATVYPQDYAKWTGPRHVFRPAPRRMFRFTPAQADFILKCDDVTPNADKTYWFGKQRLASNSTALLIVRDDEAFQVLSTHGWRDIHAQWINPKILYIWRLITDQRGYYCLYDVEQDKVLAEEMFDDGSDIWQTLTGKEPKTD